MARREHLAYVVEDLENSILNIGANNNAIDRQLYKCTDAGNNNVYIGLSDGSLALLVTQDSMSETVLSTGNVTDTEGIIGGGTVDLQDILDELSEAANYIPVGGIPQHRVVFGGASGEISYDAGFVFKNGKLGVNNSNPDWDVDVIGTSTLVHVKRIANFTNGSPGFIMARTRGSIGSESDINHGDALGKFVFRGRVSGTDVAYGSFFYRTLSKTVGDGVFAFTKNNNVDEVMSIYNRTGNIGINTYPGIPTEKLDVNGKIRARGTVQNNALTDILVEDSNGVIHSRELSSLPYDNYDKWTLGADAGGSPRNITSGGILEITGNTSVVDTEIDGNRLEINVDTDLSQYNNGTSKFVTALDLTGYQEAYDWLQHCNFPGASRTNPLNQLTVENGAIRVKTDAATPPGATATMAETVMHFSYSTPGGCSGGGCEHTEDIAPVLDTIMSESDSCAKISTSMYGIFELQIRAIKVTGASTSDIEVEVYNLVLYKDQSNNWSILQNDTSPDVIYQGTNMPNITFTTLNTRVFVNFEAPFGTGDFEVSLNIKAFNQVNTTV